MTAGEPLFVDANVLVYARIGGAPFHRGAMQRLEEAHREGIALGVSRQILREYLATLSRP